MTVHVTPAWHPSVPDWYALQAHDNDVRDLIAAVDKQGSGYISYDSFEAVMAHSMLQHAATGESADPSKTARLQPDSFALPFHEVHFPPYSLLIGFYTFLTWYVNSLWHLTIMSSIVSSVLWLSANASIH